MRYSVQEALETRKWSSGRVLWKGQKKEAWMKMNNSADGRHPRKGSVGEKHTLFLIVQYRRPSFAASP